MFRLARLDHFLGVRPADFGEMVEARFIAGEPLAERAQLRL